MSRISILSKEVHSFFFYVITNFKQYIIRCAQYIIRLIKRGGDRSISDFSISIFPSTRWKMRLMARIGSSIGDHRGISSRTHSRTLEGDRPP